MIHGLKEQIQWIFFIFFLQYKFPNTTFLGFETVTLVPYEPNLINYDLLSQSQVI